MDEIKRNLEVLGLKPGASMEEVKAAYRELAMVWHPDRFPADSPLQAKATAKLKELNSAYEYLMTHGFKDAIAIIPEVTEAETGPSASPEESEPQETPESAPGRFGKAAWILAVLLICAVVGGWWVYHGRENSKSPAVVKNPPAGVAEVAPPLSNAAVAPSNLNPPSVPAVASAATDLLRTMRPGGDQAVTTNGEGLVISRDSWVHTREEYSPPFVVHTIAKTDLTNIRLAFSRGVVIFNWEMNASELRFHDPATGQISPVAGQGKVPVNEWQDIEWFVETNSSRIVVNGTERARFTGNYATLADPVAIGTARGGTVTVKQFEVRKTGTSAVKATLGPTAGLVLYLPFASDENGIVTDLSGFKNNGTVHGAKFSREGKVGGAMSFHGGKGEGDFISVPHSSSLISMQRTRQITLCAWIKPNSLPDEFPVLLAKGGNHAPKSFGGYELVFRARKENDIDFNSGNSGLTAGHTRGAWMSDHLNEWIHVAVVLNAAAGSPKVYVNGERAGDESTSGKDWHDANFAVANSLLIGGPDPAHNPNRAWFDGLIDEVRVYARALTAEEIRQLPGF